MLDAVFVAALLITINSVLRPLSRFIDRRSLAVIDTHALYRLRLSCDGDSESEAEHRITHAIAARALVLREIRM
jgi:putative Mg2+ transporter-C (MgtC) family protein